MGSSCCRPKGEKSPKISFRKIFSRWSHRISHKSDTVKIADIEKDGNLFKRKDSIVVADPEFETPESEERNHVVMHNTEAPSRALPKKKTRMHNKRVSFQSDVEIMRTASSKSLDRFTVTIVQEEPKPRSKSFDSFFDVTTLSPPHESLKKRRTSSLENLPIEELPGNITCITAKLRRDTLGDPLDFQSYKRPMTLPTPEEPVIEEEEDSEGTDEEQVTSFKLAAKLRRDTLGDALLLATKSRYHDDTPTGSSTEDLEETVKHSKLCSKLRRDTFGDALRQAVHCKACSSMEDITELENSHEEDHEEIKITVEEVITTSILSDGSSTSRPKETKSTWFQRETKCKTCASLEVNNQDQCVKCSSSEHIPELSNGIDEIHVSSKLPDKQPSPTTPVKQFLLSDADISETLEKIRTTGKIEPKEPYNLVYSSSLKGPFASSKENINESGKSSSTDSLNVSDINKNLILNKSDQNQNQIT